MANAIDKAWDYAWDRLFCGETNLFYDYVVNGLPDGHISFLPSPELINADVPNPCGWGTGMEDSMLSAGSMLDAVVARYAVTGDGAMKPYADRVFAGMTLCANASKRAGFLPRSVSPADGKSHYTNSSRDQYTHWVYAALRFYDSPLCDDAQKEDIRNALSAFACRLEADVTPENEYSILREDGKIGLVCQMWGNLNVHEWLRMPMMYAAAWYVTGNGHFFDLYRKYRDEAYRKSAEFDTIQGDAYCALQMAYSVRALYIVDPDPIFHKLCASLLQKIAHTVQNVAAERAARVCDPAYRPYLGYTYLPWDRVTAEYRDFVGGKAYYIPHQCKTAENPSFYDVREIGEAAAIEALAPGGEDRSKLLLRAIEDAARVIDYEKHTSYAPLSLACGYWLTREAAQARAR